MNIDDSIMASIDALASSPLCHAVPAEFTPIGPLRSVREELLARIRVIQKRGTSHQQRKCAQIERAWDAGALQTHEALLQIVHYRPRRKQQNPDQ